MFLLRSLFFCLLLVGCSPELPVLSVDKGCYTVKLIAGKMKMSGGYFPATYERTRFGMRIVSEEPLFHDEVTARLRPACVDCDEGYPTTLSIISEYEIYIRSELIELCLAPCSETEHHRLYICI